MGRRIVNCLSDADTRYGMAVFIYYLLGGADQGAADTAVLIHCHYIEIVDLRYSRFRKRWIFGCPKDICVSGNLVIDRRDESHTLASTVLFKICFVLWPELIPRGEDEWDRIYVGRFHFAYDEIHT